MNGSGGGSAESDLGVDVDTTPHVVDADDPYIQYSGRIDFSDPKTAVYASPGVSVSIRFVGTGISALLGDEFRSGTERGFHDIILDGQVRGKLALEKGQDKYELASGLTLGLHTVRLVKRTQASLGKAMFKGFEVSGLVREPEEKPALEIEFIGDSVTAGEGVDGVKGTAECGQNARGASGGWGQPFHDGYRSYAVTAARELRAEYHLMAASGIGLVRDHSQMYDARTMADVYDLMFVEEKESPGWDHTRYIPDIVVIALGTNDFSRGDAPAAAPRAEMDVPTYTAAYVAFVTKLRGYYPDAEVFALSSQLLADEAGDYTPATDLRAAVAAAAQQLNEQGDPKVHSFVTSKVAGLACSGHPNAEQQEQLGLELATEIERVLGM
jgi:Carbohydrate esterase 2 N-terminal/GDSL-like Lipase/Acylhydrolase family